MFNIKLIGAEGFHPTKFSFFFASYCFVVRCCFKCFVFFVLRHPQVSQVLERIRITRFLYANEAHNILMTGLGTHERFTIEIRFLCVPVFSIRQRK